MTSATSKTINLLATDTSGNTATTSFNVTVKPLRDKYRVGTSSTAANPVRIANISNNATVSQADQTAIINSLTFTSNAPNRNYATASANEITSKTVSNVSRTGNNANVTVTVTYQDGTTSTVTVPVKHVIPEIVAHSHYTVQGQDFPAGNGSSASDYFKLSNGSAIPDATITWVSGQAPNKDNTRIGEDITVTANILIDGETTPITKTATYKVVSSVPKHVFETNRGAVFPGVSDVYDAKQYVKPVNDSWTQNAQRMNFQFTNSYGPSKDVVGISTRDIRVTYDNHQTQIIKILAKVKPDPPRIDGNSVTYKAGLTNQQIKINNVLSNSSIKLFKADNTPLTITNTTYGSGNTAVVTVSDALPNGVIKARSSITMNNVTYTTQDEHGRAIDVTRNESVDSNDSATVTVTPQLQATTEGAVFIKGGDGFDFGHVERFIQNPPHGATVAWHDSPDTWKNTVGNTHKTAVVTLPSGQGTRNVEVPVKVYPVANAKAPSRDVKGQNLTNGTDAMNYITFDPNTNTNGITAAWANRQQPNNQQAGVQHLNVDVTYPGISAAKRVSVTVNVYQFEFPQTTYTTTVGGTLASGTQASGYAHMQNANGLPTDGFTYKWNRDTTGTNDANWAAMNKPNAAKVVNAKYDVIYNGHTFVTSLPAKFVVKDVQPAKPTVTETAAGAITITPGANQTVNTHAGNVTTYADKLVIKRNGNVVTTFTRHNNTSPWVKEASAATVAGIAGTNNGITVAAGTFNPADTIQVVATQGSGETISDEQRSDDFTVVAPQPNQATTKIWQNGHIDITPNNPSGHLINPTQAMDIAYTEKVGNGAEHSKTINVVRGQNNQWTIANKPDYVTLDAHTGKVTFNANTVKPNSAITITPKAGTGHSASSNPSTLTAPATHTVNTTEIVKDYGSNVTAAEINNAVQVANKRTATIKNGAAMPTNLAGGSTTTIPVTVTYNDGSTEEVQESIFTKADKRELITAKNHLDDPVSTDGKKPGTITQYNNAIHNAQQQINTAKTEAQQVINNDRATAQQVSDALTKVRAAQTKIDQAKALLQNKEDNSQLVTSKNNLQSSVNQVPSTAGMTQQSIDNYNAKKREAESEITAAQRVIDNGDATAQQISDEKHRVDNALTALNQAKQNLTADTHTLEQAVQQLNRTGTTTGKKPASITAYNNSIRALQSDLTSAKNSANAIIQKPIRSVQEVQTALTNVNRVNDKITQAINQLVPLADNSALRTAKTKLDEEINKSVTTDGMTQSSIQAYENAKRAGQTESTKAQNVINNGDATDQQIAAEKAKVEEKYNSLKQAIAGLTPDLAPLQAAKTQLQNDIDQPTSTTGMTSASVATFNEKLSAARTKIQEIDRVLASHPDVATIRQNVTAANAAKSALDQARNGLTVDKAPLENAKNQLQHSIDTQTSTTGMTQDSVNAYNAKLTAARNKIQQINQVLAGSPTVDQINTNTSAANQAKSDLDHARQALTPDKAPLQNAKTQLEQSINQPTDTTGMTTASLNAYNQKLQAARQKLTEINQVLNGNPTVQNINDKVAEANQAKDQLNTARQGLTLDRQPALTTLHGASNLNQAQQNNFTQQINAAPNHAALETIKSNITALNNAMTKLKESVADNNTIKSGQNYTDATTANKQAYDNAVNAAKGVIGETTNPTMDVNTVNQKAETVKSTKGALDGQQNLQRAKTEATNAITHASDLNQAQKNALTQQVNSAQNVQAVNDIKQTTQSLNTAMTGLKRGVANHNQVVQSDNYVNADTNKKNDYNNAYNHANDIINGNAQHPVITPSDVNNALSNVTSKEHALNGEAKLNAAKQEANTALGHLNNLNNAQRQNLQSQINGAHQIEAVNTIKQNATNLNSAMGNLRQAVADKEQVKRTEDYADADTAKQNAYNSAVSSAETIINQSTNPTMSVNDVNSATSAVTTNKNALNGDEKLAQSKTDAVRAIDALPHLNNAQKADVKSKINAASNIAGVNTVKQQGTDLNTAMGNLQGAINDEQTTLNSQNYQDATPSKKTAYTNAVQAAKDILNKSNRQNKTKDQVTEAMNQVNSAKTNLDGTRLLDQAKQTAKQQLNNMTHLTTAQKTNLTNQINSGTTVAGVHTVQSKANTLDQAMNTLRQSIANKDATKASEDYVDANNDKQTAYNNAVAAAETIINANSNPEMNPSTITQKAEQVNSSKTALNGDENLAAAKQNAKTYLNSLTSITDAQKNNLISQISSATRVSGVDTVKQNAQHLDQAMANLQNGINNESQVKSSEKYRDADTNKQQEYDNAITAAKAILNKSTGPNTAQNAVEAALQRVNTAKDALNGDAKLIAAQNAAKQHLGTLTHITTAQRNDLTNQISQATNLAGVESVKQSANSLDGAMGNLQTAINDKSGTLASQNFLDADEQKRNAYNQAVSAAETILNKQTGPNTAKTAVEQALNNVNSAKHALNGTQNLNNAKQAAITAINGASDLNQKQKDALKAQANGAQRVSNAQDVQRNATELNTAMGTLKHAIADKTNTLASSKYVNADSTKQNDYTTKVTNAEHIISGTPTVVTTPSEVTAAANQVNSAKQELNGDERLHVAKQNANTAIDALTQLNTPQKAKLKEQVGQANRLEDVQTVQTNGQSLNNAMKGLRDSIANETTVKASQNYTDASPNNQSTYNSAVSNAKGIINQTNNPTMDVSAITQATTQVNNAKNGLNGAENLRNAQNTAKQNLNTLSHLTNNQKSAISSQIDRAGHVSEVTAAKNAATELNTQMGNLEQAIHDQNTVKQGVNFTDADKAKRDAYTNAVSRAETILNKTQGANTSKQDVEAAIQNVTSAKNALNGNQNVTNAKNTAKHALNNLTSINNAQKRDLTTKIDQATTVAGVEAVSNTGTQLNAAMANLQNGINDKAHTLASENYHDADSDKKTAYNQAVTNAENILNKNSGSNLDKAAVENALSQVTNAKGALNGNHNLEQAKSNANTTINGLQHLTTAQKDKLKQQVQQAQNVAGVDTVKTNANTLDGAMNSLQGSINDKDATLRNQNYLDADESKRNAYTQAVTAAEGILNKQTGGNTSKADVDNALNAVTRAKAALNGAENLRNTKTSATNTINGLQHLTQLQKDNLKHQIEQAQNVAGVNGVKDKGNTLNTAMGALRTSIQNDNTTKTSQNYLDASDSNKNNYNTAVNNANGVINATNNPNMDANAINGMANQVNTTKAALNGAQNLAQAKTNATNTINNAHDLNQKQKDALKTQVNNAQRVSDANNAQHTATELNGAMTALKVAITDKERTKASGNYVNADQEKRQAYDSKVTNAENIINGTPNATLTVNDVNSATSQVNAAKTALNGDNNLRVAKENANNTIDGLAQLNNAQKAKLKEQVQSATTLDGVQTVKNSSQTLNTAMKGLRDSIANEATIKAGQNYTDASPNNRNEYDSAVTAAKAIINQTSNPTMEPNTITQATSQVTTKEHALNGAQNLAQAKTTAKNNLNNLASINNAQKDALTRSIDGATTVAGVNQETAKATELNNAMHSLQNGINDETQTKQTQKYLDAEPSKKSAYDQAVNAAKAILTKASGQNVDKAAVEQALQNVNSTKTALNGDAKLNEAKAAAKQTLGTLTHINNSQRTALDNEITQATNVEGVNTVKAKAQQLDGAMGQLETSIRDKDTTLQSQNYQDADDAKRTAYSQAVNAAATILNKTAGGNTPKADVERAMQAVTQANTALNGIQNLERAKQAANTAITNASDLNTKQKEALKAQVTSAGRVSAANGVEHTATELNTAMTALKRAIADKDDTKASGNYVNADANKRQAYDEKVTAAENIVSGTPTPTLTPSDVTNAATQVTNAKTQLNGNHNLEVAKQNANTAIDGLTSLNGPQKAKLKEQVGQATTLPNVQTVRDNAQTLNTAMKGLRDSIANEATIKAGQNYTDASQNKQTDYNNAVTAAKAIIGQTTSPTMNAQEINQAKDQVTAKQQALNGQENLRTAQTNAKQHLNGLSDLTNAQKDAAKRQIEGATHVNEVTQAQNNADALNTAMTNLKNGIQDQNTIKQGVNFTDADEAKRNAYTNAVTQAEQILNKAQGPNTAKDNVETALQNVQRAKNELNGNQNVANAKTTAKNALNNLTSINNAQKEALKSQIEGATTVAGVNQVSTTASELNTAMSNLQNGINDEAATKAAQKYTDADRDKQTAYNDAVTAAKTLLDKTAGTNDNKAAVEQALQRVNTAKTALNGDARLNEAKNTAKQQLATMSHLTDAQKANLTEQIDRGTTVAGVQGIQANAGTLDQAMNQLRQSIASKDATKSSEDYQDANADLQNAYNRAVSDAEGIISATNNPEMNPDTINQKASQVNSAKSALNGDEKLAAAKQTAKTDIGRLTDLNNAQRTAANAEVDQAPNLAAVTAAKNKATSLNTVMGNLKHALAEKDNTKRSVNYTDADRPKQQAYDTAVTQAEAITNANGSNANETQVQAALNQLNQAKNDLNGDNKVAQAKESAKRALASYSNLNNAQSTAATSQIDNATTVAGVTAAQNTANELNTAMGQLQNGIIDQNTVKQQVNFTDADQGKKDAYTNAVTNAQGILEKVHGQNMTKAQVEAALNQVTTAKNALNGDANVRQAKSDAKANLGTLTHLNNAQKQDLTSQIEGATTVNGVNGVKTKAQDLDGAMQRLQSAIANKDQTKASENYIDADPTKKTAFDNAITQAESYLNKDHGANKDKQAVEQAIQSVTSTENALNGDANLQRAKTEATQAIDNLTHLNTPQKTALKQQVNAAQRVSGVTDLKNSATSLNNSMDQLKQAIDDHDTIVASGNYTNASPDKQGAYTDAYNAAKNIVNGSPNVITNAADVTAATQRVNNAETGLNGDTNLATAKQQAKEALRQMTHLSDAQKQSITGQIDNATLVTGVQSVKDNAKNLDNAMNQLRNSIANKDEVKASQPYVDADTDKQNAYNTAVTSAENIINATSQPTLDPSAVTQAANQVNTNKTALNGAQNLANKKQETTANINQLSHLNNAQKQDLNTQVTNAPNISTVNQVKTKAEQLDRAMERLFNGIQDKNQVKQSVNFTDADPEKQTAYNNAVTAAENIINQANGTNANQSQVEAALSTVTTTKQALNGDRKVTDAKNNANQTLSTLDNLNNAQKGAVTGNINQAHTVAEVTQAIQTAQELNTAMGNLKNSLNDKDTTLGSQNFADADPEKKNAYNEAVRNAENILNKSTGTNVPKDQVEAAMNQVNTTKAALNGTQNLEKAKQHANTAIDGLSHLTNAQKDALKQLVQQSTTVSEAQGNEQKANNVDAAMDKLRQSIADNATTKQNQNYTDASPNKKDAYNNAVTTAQGIIDQTTSPTLDPNVINQAAGQVNTTKNALNGNENLEAAKQQATQSLGSLDNLNNAQKQAVTNQINGAHTVDEANQIKQNAQNLNTAMGNLKQAIADKDATKATVNFTDADQAKQQAYNTAVTNAENIISKANGGNATQTEVEQAIQQVNSAKQALNGNANVQHAKDEATALINNSNDLNQAQRDALKQQVQNATTVAGVNNVKQTAQELNNAMTQLKQGIADKEQTKADGNFVNADPDKQNAYNQAVAKAEALISGTPDVVVTPSEITAALNKVTQAKNDLNGNTNLATAKQNVQHAIDQLPNLNQAQRDEYSKQITQATLVPNVNAIQQAATTLNDAMTQLKQGIANKAQIKGSENYHDADTDKQIAYDNAVTKAEELLKQTTNPTMDPNTIQQALTKVNDTNQALNGNQKLADAKQAAKTNLGTLDHLNDAQKQALTTQVEQAPDIATVNNVKQNAQNLNNAMTNLNNALHDKTETLNSINFTDADKAKKDAYTNAVAHAEGILSKANGSNASQTEVEQAMQRVNEAKQALNGNDNVQRAKDAAKQVITNANDLNQAQKDALKKQVDAAQTVANVNTIKQTAQDLNQAMTQLKQGIADKDQSKANGNFVNADTNKQNAYNNAVAHAEQIISGTPNANVDPQQVTQAKGDLNGNHNLQVAKDNANTAIDQLPNLNQPQKTALKDQVSHAELVTGVNAIKQNADALNNAMGTLKQQIQANSQVPQSVDFTQADQDKQQAYNNAANQAQQIANGTPTPVLTPDTVTQTVTTMNQAKDALNGDEKLAQAKQDAIANLDTLRDLNQPQRDALRNQINQAQALATVEQTKQNAQNVNTAMSNLKQGIANKDTVKASENYHDADADKQTAYTNAVSQAEGIINQTTNPTLNPDDITRALTQVTDAKNGLNGEAKLATEKQNAKDAVNAMTHLNDAQKQALNGQIDQSPEIATVNQVKQTATSLDQAMNQLSQAINDKAQTLADGNYLNANPDKQNAYKQAVAKAEALLNKQSGTNEVQAQVESITNEVNTAKQALNGNDNLANAKQQAKQQLANLTHLNDAQKQSFESQITQAPLVTDVTTINQKAQALDHAMELLRNSIADNQATLASEDYHDATAQRQNDYNQAVTAAKNIINQTTSPTMNPDEVNRATTQVNNTKVALDGDENLAAAKQQANNRLNQLDHLNNAQKQQLQSQITQSSDIATVNGHKQTAESLNTAMGNLINAIADHQAVEQRGNFINADTDKQTAYTTAVNEAEAMINKQTGQNANQTEVEQAITKVQTTLQALNGDHNLQVAKTNATQAIDALTSLNDPQKTALKDQVTAATLVTAVHQIEQNANTLNQAMHGLRESIQDNAATKANSKYINEDQPEQQNYDQAVQAANSIINEQTATLDNNAINQAATTVNTTKAALHGDVKLQNDKDHAKQTVSQLAHLNNAQKHMEDTLIDSETTRTAVKQDLTEAQALDQLMNTLQQSIADKDATRASSAYVNAEPNKKQAYDEAVQNAESIIAGLNNPTINKGNVSSATQAVTTSKNGLDGVERLAQDKQTAGNSLNHLDQLTPAQQQALENQINNATTRDKVAEIIAQAQALNEAMKALKESIKDQPQTEASSKFINEDQAQKDAYTQAVQHAKDLINKTTDPTLVKSVIDQATQAVNDAKNNLHGDQKLAQDKQRATETLNNLSNLNTPQRQALENQINNATTRGEVAQKLTEAQALNQAMEALRNSIQDQQQTEAGSKFINEDKPQKDAYQAAVQHAKDLINQTSNPTLDKAQVEQLTQGVNQAKDNLHGDQKLADDKQHAVTDLNQLNSLNNPQRQALES
ncbi:putative CRISPR-associated protein Csc2 [Staphylococcus aureus subsp. aureus 21235]|nr:putative CRISPR-associated protein Csc2 [Staphylococcus aureus subsp. aureus 21235]SUL97572.1 Erythrocyte membrane binding protein [Staphylococcus aureus]